MITYGTSKTHTPVLDVFWRGPCWTEIPCCAATTLQKTPKTTATSTSVNFFIVSNFCWLKPPRQQCWLVHNQTLTHFLRLFLFELIPAESYLFPVQLCLESRKHGFIVSIATAVYRFTGQSCHIVLFKLVCLVNFTKFKT